MKKLLFLLIFLILSPSLRADEPERELISSPYVSDRHYQSPIQEVTNKLSFSLATDFFSRYVSRGQAASTGPVWQPSAYIAAHGAGFSVWGNYVLNNEPNQGEFNEIDLMPYYGTHFGKVEFDTSMSGIFYVNRNRASLNTNPNSLESDFHLAYPVGFLKVFADSTIQWIGTRGAFYGQIGVRHQWDLKDNFHIKTSTWVGMANNIYNKVNLADVGFKLNQFAFALQFPWAPAKGWGVAPSFHVSTLLPHSLRRAVASPTLVWGGISLTYDF